MKRTFLLIIMTLAVLLTSSCQKEELGRILTATIEQYEHDAKAYINNDYYACWEGGDTVALNGEKYPVSVNAESGSATIVGTESLLGNLTAFYPANLIGLDMATVTLPNVQHYATRDGHQVVQSPMAAYCSAGGAELKFRNLCALLKVTLPTMAESEVVYIVVRGNKGQPLSGTAQLRISEGLPKLSSFSNGCDSIILDNIHVALTESRSFYIVVPANSSFSEMTVSVAMRKSDNSFHIHRKYNDIFDKVLERNHIGAFAYNLDGDTLVYPPWQVLTYTTNDGNSITPNSPTRVVYQEYGYIVYAAKPSFSIVAFRNFTTLTSVMMPDSVATIGSEVFSGCSNLQSVTLPSNLKFLPLYAFSGCTSLTSVTLPSNMTGMGDGAFYNCSSLQSITLPSGMTRIDNHLFRGCSGLTSITLPDGITWIGESAFRNCSSLGSITLPSGITSIGESAFEACSSLSSITLPSGVTSIGVSSFMNCSGLSRVNCYAITPPTLGTNAFLSISSQAEFHVPGGCRNDYNIDPWNIYFYFISGDL